jgi:ElaB/YqjD/DUF883 family membrane-anchored ribosome-binding protein
MADPDMSAEIRQLKEDLATLQQDVSGLTGLIRELGTERFDTVKASTVENLRARRETLRRRLAAAEARGRETAEDIQDSIGGHPLGSVAMAFGLGFLVARLWDAGARR